MRRTLSIGLVVIGCLSGALSAAQTPALPRTVAESSRYSRTSTYREVVEFIRQIQAKSPYVRVEQIGRSTRGQSIPLVVVGDPPPASPAALARDDRLVVYLQGNIHAGEVEGKEALLALLRDIAGRAKPPFLDRLVLLICPIFNIDGNDQISPKNRRNQLGPKQGVGVRYNGQMLDLNRDSIKLESPEMRGLVENVLMRWDPALVVDCHTTNGSVHEEPVTYSWALNPNGDPDLIAFSRDRMMPQIEAHLKATSGTLAIPYGHFRGETQVDGWGTFGHKPRFLTNYIGLRNRLSILVENYAYASYKTRVRGNYQFAMSILEFCHQHQQEISRMIAQADQRTIRRGSAPKPTDRFGIETELQPTPKPVTILSWEMKRNPKGRYPRFVKDGNKKKYTLPYYADFAITEAVPLPYAYLMAVDAPHIAEKLMQHGVVVEALTKPATLNVQAFETTEIRTEPELFQGHRLTSIKGKPAMKKMRFPAGSLCVRTAQPLGRLAAYLLEPQSDDGLLVWNFFDRYLVTQWYRKPKTYPVYKLIQPTRLVTEAVR